MDKITIDAVIAASGRPSEMEGGRRVNVYLDAYSLAIAAEIGNGNVSAGIRAAIKQSSKKIPAEQSSTRGVSHREGGGPEAAKEETAGLC